MLFDLCVRLVVELSEFVGGMTVVELIGNVVFCV